MGASRRHCSALHFREDVLTSARLFGWAHLSLARRTSEVLLGLVYGEGWAAALAHRTGLQGSVGAAEHALHLCQRPADAPPLRVGFASDFHAGPTTHPALLRAACAALAEADVDLLLLGGDFVSLHARHVERLTGLLASVPAPLGRFAVLGNHDLWADDAFITARLEEAGIQVLTNRNVRLAAPHDDVWVCGLDDPTRGAPDAAAALHGAEGRRLVLMHSPDGLLALQSRRFDIAFCGHTHAGQISLPGSRLLVVPEGDLSRRYPSGHFQLDDGGERQLLVSPGIGCSTVPVRLFAPPRVHICELRGIQDGARPAVDAALPMIERPAASR